MSERIGGHGFQHRRVRREEEIVWLAANGVNTVVSLLPGNQNQAAYTLAGFDYHNHAITPELEAGQIGDVFAVLDRALASPESVALVHRDIIDDTVVGILGGYLVHAGLIEDPILATSIIQEITGRALGPEGRRLIPTPGGR